MDFGFGVWIRIFKSLGSSANSMTSFFKSLMCMIWFMENISLSNQQTHVHQFLHQLCLHLLAPEGILSSRDESFIICFSDICIYKNKQKLNSLVSAFSISNIIGIVLKISIVCWTSKDHYAFYVDTFEPRLIE